MSIIRQNQADDTLRVLIPGLIPPPEMLSPLLERTELPALARLLSRASRQTCSGNISSALCQAMGLTPEPDWPLAPLILTGSGKNLAAGYWLRADPVHLRADRDQLVLVDSNSLQLDADEADAIIHAFNAHFVTENLTLHRTGTHNWFLHRRTPLDIVTVPLAEATGKPVNSRLPTGRDALVMHRLFNEIQMLLFDLPVNRERESRGLPTINSIWCWGGGTLPAPVPAGQPQTLISQNQDWADISRGAGWTHLPLPDNANRLPEYGWLLLDQLSAAAQYGDYSNWLDNIRQIDQLWLAPLLQQLARGLRKTLEIRGSNLQGEMMCWTIRSSSRWQFWRNAPLTSTLTRSNT